MSDSHVQIGDLQALVAKAKHPLFSYSAELTNDGFFMVKIQSKCKDIQVDVAPVVIKTTLINKTTAETFVKNITETLGKRLAKDLLLFEE